MKKNTKYNFGRIRFLLYNKKKWKIDLFKTFGDIDHFYWSTFTYNINLGWVDNYDIYCYFLIQVWYSVLVLLPQTINILLKTHVQDGVMSV